LARFFSPVVLNKLIKEIAPRYKERAGGYTRIIRLGKRAEDGAKEAFIELLK
jgi:large subunit ribosomal protein L17